MGFVGSATVGIVVKLLIPLALAAAVLVSAMTVGPHRSNAKPAPTRSLQINH